MGTFVADCPRCNASKSTFDILAQNNTFRTVRGIDWRKIFEIYSVCRHCMKGTIFLVSIKDYAKRDLPTTNDGPGLVLYSGSINIAMEHEGFVCIKDLGPIECPEHLPESVEAAFNEACICMQVNCWNAAGAMFRTSIDLATKVRLPPPDQEPAAKIRRSLGLRLHWMFENDLLPNELKDLADCIHQDGNDAAHDATLTEADAYDLRDFAFELLRRLYTEPKRIELAKERRENRRRDA